MTYIEAKKKLHDYIEHASEAEVMEMMSLVEEDRSSEYVYDKATLAMFNKRSEDILSGKEETTSVEESMKRVRAQRKKDGL